MYEAEVSKKEGSERPSKKRLLSKTPVVRTNSERDDDVKEEKHDVARMESDYDSDSCTRDFCDLNGWKC